MRVLKTKIDGFKVEVIKRETGTNYNLFLHVYFPDGGLKSGCSMKDASTEVNILEKAIYMIKEKPAEIPGL